MFEDEVVHQHYTKEQVIESILNVSFIVITTIVVVVVFFSVTFD